MVNKKLTLEQRNRRNFIYEITAYVIAVLLVLFGLILIILSITGDYLEYGNFIKVAEQNTFPIFGVNGFSWRYYGLILVGLALVIYLIAAYVTSKSKDQKTNLEASKSKRTTLNLESVEKKNDSSENEVKQN